MARRHWTAAELKRLRQLYPDTPSKALAVRFGKSLSSIYQRAYGLGLHKSAAYLASPDACRLRRGGEVGKSCRYPKGHVPANKGLRRPGWAPGRMRETQFKKGVRQGVAVKLYKPIGTERLSKDGYLERKVNDDLPLQSRWRAVHLIVWEKRHGKIPRHHALTFKNGDRADIRIGNLKIVHRRELMRRNTVHNLPPSLKKAVMQLGVLNRQINRRSA